MLTRKEIESQYDCRNGYVRSPGKFEGEPCYVVALYEAVLHGLSDEVLSDGEYRYDVFRVDDDLRAQWPEIDRSAVEVWIRETDSGFVMHAEMTARESANERDRIEVACYSDE